ncbi:MAG: DUF2252 domain-containing protein [Thermoplasmata archaeon]|jgi:uncharacterized protein (DUF2252 family)
MAISRTPARPFRDLSTRAERYAAGKALRRRVPRSSHASWNPAPDRPDPCELLERSDRSRVARLLPIRYGRMALSPFTFLRGSAGVMAHDLATTPTTGLRAQLCGDAHVGNFGAFATPERDRVFDVNDFDETLPGPWEWDVKRLATSLVLAARQNGFSGGIPRKAARAALRSYRRSMSMYARMRYLDLWYAHLDLESLSSQVPGAGRKDIRRTLAKARHRTGFHAFPLLAEPVRGRYRIRDAPPLIVHYLRHADAATSARFYADYLATLTTERRMILERYHLVDVAQKVVGVGSVGTVCSILLLMGDDDVRDPLFLQLKQAEASVLEPYVDPSVYHNHAERVVVGQHLIQEASDVLLGWSTLDSKDFYVRQLRDMRASIDVWTLGPKGLVGKGEACGAALARAHARTGDPARISGYLGEGSAFDEAVTEFAEAYAVQTERDHAEFLQAIKNGRLPVAVGL